MIERMLGVDMQGPGVIVSVNTTDLGNVQFQVLLSCPTQGAFVLERTITTEFLDAVGSEAIPGRRAPTGVPL